MTCFDGLYLKKLCSACSVLGQNIDVSFGPNKAPLDSMMVHSACSITLLLAFASFDGALPSESKKPSLR